MAVTWRANSTRYTTTMDDRLVMQNACVAVVEDDPVNRQILVTILVEASYEVWAWNGAARSAVFGRQRVSPHQL
jgi:hypothetical protein